MFLHIMIGRNPKKSNVKETKLLYFYMMLCFCIFVPQIYMSHHVKKCKYTPKKIEMILNLYKICNIY
jgi:hypothetical protein